MSLPSVLVGVGVGLVWIKLIQCRKEWPTRNSQKWLAKVVGKSGNAQCKREAWSRQKND